MTPHVPFSASPKLTELGLADPSIPILEGLANIKSGSKSGRDGLPISSSPVTGDDIT
jgi:hypothetical protein